VAVQGYGPASYGDAMADVYDDWYGGAGTTAATVARLAALADGGPVLELGVGTGRLAIPLAGSGIEVHGVDASEAMLERLRRKDAGGRVRTAVADMAAPDGWPPGPFRLVVVAVNTLFNVTTAEGQHSCVQGAAERLLPGGRLVVEAFVPAEDGHHGPALTVRTVAPDHVVLLASTTEPGTQTAVGHFVELRDGEPVRLRPWQVRWATPAQLDHLAEQAGLVLEHRWAGWDAEAFGPDSTSHVSVYRRPVSPPAG
jgi:SAM-dependent methyltransferase